MLNLQHQHNNHTTIPHMRGCCVVVVMVLCMNQIPRKNYANLVGTDWCTTPTQHGHNTPSHEDGAQVNTHWAPPSCEGILYPCCVGVVKLIFHNPLK
jgi:hypothetical protein